MSKSKKQKMKQFRDTFPKETLIYWLINTEINKVSNPNDKENIGGY